MAVRKSRRLRRNLRKSRRYRKSKNYRGGRKITPITLQYLLKFQKYYIEARENERYDLHYKSDKNPGTLEYINERNTALRNEFKDATLKAWDDPKIYSVIIDFTQGERNRYTDEQFENLRKIVQNYNNYEHFLPNGKKQFLSLQDYYISDANDIVEDLKLKLYDDDERERSRDRP